MTCAALRRLAADGDPVPPPELDETLVAELSHGTEDRVGVHAEHRGQIPRRRESFAGDGFAVGDGSTDFGRHLFVEEGRVAGVDVELRHSANEISTTGVEPQRRRRRTS